MSIPTLPSRPTMCSISIIPSGCACKFPPFYQGYNQGCTKILVQMYSMWPYL